MLEVTDNTFTDEVKNSSIPVLVDFWAAWCAPCRMIKPHLQSIDKEYDGKLKVVTYDIDENDSIQEKYNVKSIPYLMLWKDGKFIDDHIGALNKSALINFIEKAL